MAAAKMAVKTAPESIFVDQASDLGSVRLHKSEVSVNGESRRRPRAMFACLRSIVLCGFPALAALLWSSLCSRVVSLLPPLWASALSELPGLDLD